VSELIKRHRNGKPVKRTYAQELQLAFRHFGYEMSLVANLSNTPPTLATWERERSDMDAAYIVLSPVIGLQFAESGFAIRSPTVCR
jgi:hypothetical protein